MIEFKASPVFSELNAAINARKPDGSRQYTIIILEGGSRSSKTWSLYQQLLSEALQGHRRRICILRDTQKDCRSKVEPNFIKWYNDPMNRAQDLEDKKISPKQYAEYLQKESLAPYIIRNKTEHKHTIKTLENVIEFTGADDDNGVIGLDPDIFWVNEPYLFDQLVFDEIEQRTNEYTIIDWNPRFDHWIDDLKLRENCIVLHSTFLKNPFLKKKVRDGLLSRQPLSNDYIDTDFNVKPLLQLDNVEDVSMQVEHLEDKIQKEIIRCWNNEKQKTAHKYRWEVYGLGIKSEKPNKVYHGWEATDKEFFDKINEPEYYSTDMGLVNPTATVGLKYRENCLFVHEYLYIPGRELDSLPLALERAKVVKDRPMICDRDVRGNSMEDSVTLIELHNSGYAYAIPAIKGAGSHIGGIQAIQHLNVYVTRTSKNVWSEYYEYEFSKYNGQLTDIPIKKNDHAMDAIKQGFNYMRIELGISL